MLIALRNLEKSYPQGPARSYVLRRITLDIKAGDEVVPGIRAVDAAGHSPGMMAYLIESDGKRVLNWADTCGHYVVSLQRPDIHLDVDDDKEMAAATRKRSSALLRLTTSVWVGLRLS